MKFLPEPDWNALSIPVVEDIDPDAETALTFAEFNDGVQMLRNIHRNRHGRTSRDDS